MTKSMHDTSISDVVKMLGQAKEMINKSQEALKLHRYVAVLSDGSTRELTSDDLGNMIQNYYKLQDMLHRSQLIIDDQDMYEQICKLLEETGYDTK